MKSDSLIFVGAAVAALSLGILIGTGASGATVWIFALLGAIAVGAVGSSMARDVDSSWLLRWIMLGFTAKMVATYARHYMVTTFYGIGDSYGYHLNASEFAAEWRLGSVPSLSGAGGFGKQITEWIAGVMFAVITPDMLGGFVMFAIVAYFGQLLLYAAFRRYATPHQLKPYAFLILFMPVYSFWPSSIGKDALVILFLGASAYAVARSLEAFKLRWLLALLVVLIPLGLIRIHVAGLVVGAFVMATAIARIPAGGDTTMTLRRVLLFAGGAVAVVAILTFFPDVVGVDPLSTEDRDGFTTDLVRRSSSGTATEGGAVDSPLDVPGALVHVLFRPLIWEANEIQHLLAAVETFVFLVLFLWKLPAILRNLKHWRTNAYVVFSTFYIIAFSIAFSVFRNLGLIARQRGQVIAFFLAFVIILGWEKTEKPERVVAGKHRDRQLAAASASGSV